MSAEWPELFVALSTYPSCFNDRKPFAVGDYLMQDSHIYLMQTELYQDKSYAVIVRTKQRGLNNFFTFSRFKERLFGIAKPIANLASNVLSLVYRTELSLWGYYRRYLIKYFRHILVDITTFFALPLLAVYDVIKHKFFDELVDKQEWSGDRFLYIFFNLGIDVLSMPFIIGFEYIRHAISLVVSVLMIAIAAFAPAIGFGISRYFNAEKPASLGQINKDAIAACLNEINNEVNRYTKASIMDVDVADKRSACEDWRNQILEYLEDIPKFLKNKNLTALKNTFYDIACEDECILESDKMSHYNKYDDNAKSRAINKFKSKVNEELDFVIKNFEAGNKDELECQGDPLKSYLIEGMVRVSITPKEGLFSPSDKARDQFDQITQDRQVLEALLSA